MEAFKTSRMVVFFLMSVTLVTIPVSLSSQSLSGDSLVRAEVKLNDTIRPDSLYLLLTASGPMVEAEKFMGMVGGSFHPFSHIFHQDGLMVQYGRFISFSRLNFAQGFVNLQMVQMVPPLTTTLIGTESTYFAPLAFLAQAVGGTVTYDAVAGMLEIGTVPKLGFGSIFPPAGDVARALLDSNFIVQQGEITEEYPIQFCLAGYVDNANGNNAGVPYFGIQFPPPPGMDSLFSPPINFNFNADEVMVMIGRTPPECSYYSYRSYLMNRLYDFPPSTTRTKINASMGDMTSLYRMRPDLPLDSMFGRKFAVIMAGDSLLAMHVRNIILASTPEIPAADIHFDILPADGMFQFGSGPLADWGTFIHRVSLFKDSAAQQSYSNNPPLEILRVTPRDSSQRLFFTLHSFLPRTSGINEFALLPDMEVLEEGIYNAYQADYDIIWLQPSPWVIEGFTAIQQGKDALADNHDALYIVTSDFQFRENDIALAYGVNHTLTGQAVYTNVSIYGTKYMTGYGGVTNTMMEKSARRFISDTVTADKFFAYSFSRHPIPGNPYVYIVPSDTNGTLEGINVNDTADFGFRTYVNSLTKIGPDPMEVILDQVVLLRPHNAGIAENEKKDPGLKIYPNPATDKATLEFTVPEWSEVTLYIYDLYGQEMSDPVRIEHVRGTIRQEVTFSSSLSPGTYFIKGIITGRNNTVNKHISGTLILLGKNVR